MPGNSQRKGAVGHRGKPTAAGSGGRIRRGLEGKGPTPKAEDRPYHPAYKAKRSGAASRSGGMGQTGAEQPGAARSGGSKPGGPRSGGSKPGGPRSSGPRSSGPKSSGRGKSPGRTGRPGAGPEWVVGRNAVLEALESEIPIKSGYVADGADRDDRLREIFRIAAGRSIPLLQVTRSELDRMTGGAVHQGVALQLPAYEYLHPDDLLAAALDADDPLVIALDSVTDPRNLGAVVRSAAAFGAQGVLIPERRSAGMTAAAWKTSAGAAARIPIARATNLNRSLRAYADAGFALVGLDAGGETDISALAKETRPVVLVVGSEGGGLSRLVREACDVVACIPMSSAVESLNAGVAAGIALYEIARRHG